MTEFTRHPLSARFRDLTEAEYQALKEGLIKDGQRDAITTIENAILDGWHRYLACLDLGIEPRMVGYTGGDPEGFVNRMNDGRRHESKQDRDARIQRLRAEGKSTRQISEEVGVSRSTVQNVIDEPTEQKCSVETPATIVGKDGKKRKAKAAKHRQTKAKLEPKTADLAIPEPNLAECIHNEEPTMTPPDELLAAYLHVLNDRQRQVIEKHLNGWSVSKIADDLGVTMQTVYSSIDRSSLKVYQAHQAEISKYSLDDLAKRARNQLSQTAQQKLDKAVQLAVEAEFIKMRQEATRQVEEAIQAKQAEFEKLHEEARKNLEEAKAARDSAIEARKSIDQHMTYDEFKLVRGCLHPDKQPEELRDKYNRALQIFMRLEKSVNPHLPVSVLRQRGWEHVSPFAKSKQAH